MQTTQISNVAQYIAGFPVETQLLLEQIRAAILKAAPEAEELISYQMPGYKYSGPLVYFAGYKKHIGFYPMPSAMNAFAEELSVYKKAKGSVQFPLDKPLPLKLITKMVIFRVKENQAQANAKANKKKQ